MCPDVTLMYGCTHCAHGPWVSLKDTEDNGFQGPVSVDAP